MPGELETSQSSITFTVEQVPVRRTLALRQAVLGVPRAREVLHLAGDDDPATVAFAALGAGGEVLSVARVSLEAPTFLTDELPTGETNLPDAPARRLRGMATRPDARNQGIGSAVLEAAIAFVGLQGGGLLWCHARIPALSLYRRAGFVTYGEPWVDPLHGPHIVMWLQVSPPDNGQPGA